MGDGSGPASLYVGPARLRLALEAYRQVSRAHIGKIIVNKNSSCDARVFFFCAALRTLGLLSQKAALRALTAFADKPYKVSVYCIHWWMNVSAYLFAFTDFTFFQWELLQSSKCVSC